MPIIIECIRAAERHLKLGSKKKEIVMQQLSQSMEEEFNHFETLLSETIDMIVALGNNSFTLFNKSDSKCCQLFRKKRKESHIKNKK